MYNQVSSYPKQLNINYPYFPKVYNRIKNFMASPVDANDGIDMRLYRNHSCIDLIIDSTELSTFHENQSLDFIELFLKWTRVRVK